MPGVVQECTFSGAGRESFPINSIEIIVDNHGLFFAA